ncbi:unnamed protein product [Strongylus vulgaris]|uniref:Uncharacterized protein n=1 Tax=Strongylus vulgaris TaxID=40348 RepID=A0A3P7JMZ7_STRVU|nr:unnamed protein product [Strongylus vulgaris]
MAAYISEQELKTIDGDVKTANSFSMESLNEHSAASTCSSLPSSEVERNHK